MTSTKPTRPTTPARPRKLSPQQRRDQAAILGLVARQEREAAIMSRVPLRRLADEIPADQQED